MNILKLTNLMLKVMVLKKEENFIYSALYMMIYYAMIEHRF